MNPGASDGSQLGGFFSEMYGAGPIRFYQLLADWREQGDMEGLAVN